jgi:hypothetical protein
VADELAAEHQPVGEAVEGLGAVGDGGDLLPKVGVRQVPKKRDRPDCAAEFPERAVEAVLAGVDVGDRGAGGGDRPAVGEPLSAVGVGRPG